MLYPTDRPTAKHDLVGLRPLIKSDGSLLGSELSFRSTSKMFAAVGASHDPQQLRLLSPVYSYQDAPKHPAPLSRALVMIGVADTSLSVVRKLLSDEDNVPACLHKCIIATKRADRDGVPQLKPHEVEQAQAFASFMRRLRRDGLVAIVASDVHGRFGILQPTSVHDTGEDLDFAADEFAARLYVGRADEVKAYLTQSVMTNETTLAEPEPFAHNETSAEVTDTGSPQPSTSLWQPPSMETAHTGEESASLWQPPSMESADGMAFGNGDSGFDAWQPSTNPSEHMSGVKRARSDSDGREEHDSSFHADAGAAAADAFYSGLTRSLDTRADSRLYHMRAFNGWVKATQIQELDPQTKQSGKKAGAPLRVLDLACGKGGDLGKWVLHKRGVSNYVGVDVARGSLRDAALRARKMKKLKNCTFTCADLGADVPGRLRSPGHKHMQKLLSWSLQNESEYESEDPTFRKVRGGGISMEDKFDVVSIQFAIHYMMSSRKRARRFFHTASELLEIGGNLIATTIDARVVLDRLLDLGLDLHFEDDQVPEAVVTAGNGACQIRFHDETIRKLFHPDTREDNAFGLEYTFTLVEGSDHAAGVGDAVNLPEWLTPISELKTLAFEVGLELDSVENFHEFYANRSDPGLFPLAHNSLYNMKVLDRNGSISGEEWEISGLYAALKFRKVQESKVVLDDEKEDESESDDEDEGEATMQARLGPSTGTNSQVTSGKDEPSAVATKLLPMAMMKAKKAVGRDAWDALSSEEKKRLTQIELEKLGNC